MKRVLIIIAVISLFSIMSACVADEADYTGNPCEVSSHCSSINPQNWDCIDGICQRASNNSEDVNNDDSSSEVEIETVE